MSEDDFLVREFQQTYGHPSKSILTDDKLRQLVKLDASFGYIANRFQIPNHILSKRLRDLGLFEMID